MIEFISFRVQILPNKKCFKTFGHLKIFKIIIFLFMLIQKNSGINAAFTTTSLKLFELLHTINTEQSFSSVNFKYRRESRLNFVNTSSQNEQFLKKNQNVENSTNVSSIIFQKFPLQPHWNHPLLGILLITMTIITISGNSLVILAVVRERYLKSATNYYIASLAVADLIVGLAVMPFNSLNKMTDDFWFFGDLWCDIWHSMDVFASTASINSLLFISLDRHSAISDPMNYPTRWLSRYWVIFVALIWICSAFISFPAIAYWRWTTTEYILNRCIFSDDIYYLVFSSLVSFYVPLTIMVVVYIRIYRAATNQMNAIKTGQKLNVKTGDGSPLTLRIHRGGYHKLSKVETNMAPNGFKKSSFRAPKCPTMSNLNEHTNRNSKKYEHHIELDVAVSLSLSNLPSSSSATKNSPPPVVKNSLEKYKFHEIKSSSNSVINKTHIFHQRRFSCPCSISFGMIKISEISDKSYIELNKKYLINNSLLEQRINFSSLSSSLSLSSLFLKSAKYKTINFLYYPSLITKNAKNKKEIKTFSVRTQLPKRFLSSLDENELEHAKPSNSQTKTNLDYISNETDKLLNDCERKISIPQKINEINQVEQIELKTLTNNLVTETKKLEKEIIKEFKFSNIENDFHLNNKMLNSRSNSNICLNETDNKKHINLPALYTGDDEAVRKNILFYQKHYIEHTNKLLQADVPQTEINSKNLFLKKKYSTIKKYLSPHAKKATNEIINKQAFYSRHNSNLSYLSNVSQSLHNESINNEETDKQHVGRLKFLRQGKSYLTNKIKNLSITKKLSKFSREQKAAKTLGMLRFFYKFNF
jgi:hypothetical protein